MFVSIMMFLGGISLFIYGINNLSNHLKKLSGSKFKVFIDKVVDNVFTSILVGALITAFTSSSTVIIVLVIGLVRAGIISARQSVGLIMGANIGSTISAFIVSIPIGDYAYLILLIGLIVMFINSKKIKNIGGLIFSLGLLFIGLNVMGDGIKPLLATNTANQVFTELSKPTFSGTLLGFIFGSSFTAIVHSSSAITAIAQKLYSMNDPVNGIMTLSLRGALVVVIGANVGTTLTGIVAAIGGNEEGKRTAYIHLIFNLIAAIIFLSLLSPFANLLKLIEQHIIKASYSMVTLAFGHLIINVTTTLILVFFINQIVKLTEIMVPYKNGKKEELSFDYKLIEQSPLAALEFSKVAVNRLTENVVNYFYLTKKYSFEKNNKSVNEANTYEMVIDELDSKIHSYLICLMRRGVADKEAKELTRLLDITKDLERIGDHLSNIVEFFELRYEEGHDLSNNGKKDLQDLYLKIEKMLLEVSTSIKSDFKIKPTIVLTLEEQVDELEKAAREGYLKRLKEGEFEFFSTSNFTDILSDLERIGDHLYNITSSIIDPSLKDKEITGLKIKNISKK